MRVTRGDVWYGWFPYKDAPDKEKHRPVLVVGISPTGSGEDVVVLVMPITSFGEGGTAVRGDIPIMNWRRLGFDKPSWVRARRVWSVDMKSLDRTRGRVGAMEKSVVDQALLELSSLF